MKKIICFLLLLTTTANAGLPPTTSKGSNDASNVTTFNFQFPQFTSTHTGVTNSLSIPNTTTPTATTIASWDANKNLSANAFVPGYTTTATAGGTTTLTVSSTLLNYFTGTSNQTVVLPVVTTLVNGQQFTIVNNSTGVVTVQTSGLNTLQAMASNTLLIATVINTAGGTGTASWSFSYTPVQGTSIPTAAIGAIITGTPAATSGGPFIYPTVVYDSSSAYNNTNGQYTCPVTGFYLVSGTGAGNNGPAQVSIYKNGTLYSNIGNITNGSGYVWTASGGVYANAGDILTLRTTASYTSSASGSLTFSLVNNSIPTNSYIFVYGGAASGSGGVGSTNTWVRRFLSTDTSVGSAVTYTDSATLGGSFTINQNGVYAINYSDGIATGNGFPIITKNSTALTSTGTAFSIGTTGDAISSGHYGQANAVVPLVAGDVIRAQDANTNSRVADSSRAVEFSITLIR